VSAAFEQDAEVVDAVPVLEQQLMGPAARVTREPALAGAAAPGTVVRAAAAAAGGFVAGAAVLGLVARRQRRAAALARAPRLFGLRGAGTRSGRSAAEAGGGLLQIVGTRSLLVDVHLLGPAPDGPR
jgi:hypothetical protein